MATATVSYDLETALEHLSKDGYVVLEGILNESDLGEVRNAIDQLLARERLAPFDPEDGPTSVDDDRIEAFFAEHYTVSQAELGRLMRRIRHTRAQNYGTPWPVPPNEVNKLFLHL